MTDSHLKDYVLKAALAGLLHDVGKLEQRARTDPWNPAPGVDSPGSPVHATWTTYFAQNYLPKRFQGAVYRAAYHHQPLSAPGEDQSLGMLVALADKLSAGERADQPKDYPKKHPPQQMVSVFDRIALHGGKLREKDFHYLPLKPLSLDEDTVFAKDAEPQNVQGNAYDVLREKLEVAAKTDPGDDETYLENLLWSLQKTTWSVPSAYYHSLPDVSLYDHSRMTAALAASLAEKDESEIAALLAAVSRNFWHKPEEGDAALLNKPLVLLIGGDISGVQNFIYTISSKQAAKTLRGRSFYLQLLTEAVLRYVLRGLGLPYTNVIYSGGGHFFILAPLSAKEKLPRIQAEISKKLLRHHGTSLYLAVGWAEVSAMELQQGNFPSAWHRMHSDLNRVKKQKYTELGADFHKAVFALKEHGGNQEDTCSICGQESKKTKRIEGSDDRRCPLCASFAEKIGRKLPTSKFVAFGFVEPKMTERGTAFDALREFGVLVELAQGEEIQFDETPERAVIWALDDLSDEEHFPAVKNTPAAHATRYTVNVVPRPRNRAEADEINKRLPPNMQQDGEEKARVDAPLTFTHLQYQSIGIPRLGVLRMDVDDLGNIFKDGLGNRASLARIATLSFQTGLFFEGWLKKICEREKYNNRIYAVYAGGDDLFLIGPWNLMPQLAQEISTDLAKYTNQHPDIHISGGMAFIGGKYPVYQAAEDAEEMLDMAKDKEGKNAFAFLDYAWHWDEFDEVARHFDLLHQIDTNGGPKAIMQTLRELTIQKADSLSKNGTLLYGPWIWQGMYRIHRMIERAEKKGQNDVAENLTEIQTSLGKDYYQNLEKWGTAARWAQVCLRTKKDGE